MDVTMRKYTLPIECNNGWQKSIEYQAFGEKLYRFLGDAAEDYTSNTRMTWEVVPASGKKPARVNVAWVYEVPLVLPIRGALG